MGSDTLLDVRAGDLAARAEVDADELALQVREHVCTSVSQHSWSSGRGAYRYGRALERRANALGVVRSAYEARRVVVACGLRVAICLEHRVRLHDLLLERTHLCASARATGEPEE